MIAHNTTIRIYVNKIENRITLQIKTRHYLEILTPETMKLLSSTKSKIIKNKKGESTFCSEITEGMLVRYYITNNNYEQKSRVLHIFFPNKPFGKLLDVSLKNLIFQKTFHLEFS